MTVAAAKTLPRSVQAALGGAESGDGWAGRDVLRFTVNGQPVPKARPRWAPHGGTYTSTRTVQAEKRVAEYFKATYPHVRPAEGRLGLSVECYLTDGRQGDADNYLKLVADALNGKAWVDDFQIERMYVALFRNAEVPMTTIRIYRLEKP